MTSSQKPYLPQSVGDVMDLIGSMTLDAPKFVDTSGYWPDLSIDIAFQALNDGFDMIRKRIGDENYATLTKLSAKARSHFEADPNDVTDDTIRGRECLLAMEDVLKSAARRMPKPGVAS